jgi:hypothetical protein
MYMERIEVPADVAAARKPRALKLAAGVVFLAVAALLMAPWLCFLAAWLVVGTGVRALARLGATIRDTLLYAGELVVGR